MSVVGMTMPADIIGILTNWIGVELLLYQAFESADVVGFTAQVNDAPSGGTLVAELLVNGAPTGISATVADGAQDGTATGIATIAPGDRVTARIVSNAGGALGFGAQVQVQSSSTAAVGPALTTLAKVKAYGNVQGTGNDALLTDLINSVSQKMQRWVWRHGGQTFAEVIITGERYSAIPWQDVLTLRSWPLISVQEVRQRGSAVDSASYQLELKPAQLYYVDGYWPRGRRDLEVDYTAGYAGIPPTVQQAATEQVWFEFLQSPQSQGRLGLESKDLGLSGNAAFVEHDGLLPSTRLALGEFIGAG